MELLSRRERERNRKEQEMIDAAEILFTEKGFEKTSMDAVAKAAEYTKRTLYQYFSGKEDLFFAVSLRSYEQLKEYMHREIRRDASGWEKLNQACQGFYRFYREQPGRFFLMNQIGRVNRDTPDSPFRQRWLKSDAELFNATADLIREGRADGSIRSSDDGTPDEYTVSFLLTAFFQLYALTGEAYIHHFGLPADEFIGKCLFNIIEPLKKERDPEK